MKIAMIYICTGNYDIFWNDFYSSSENNFLPDCQKHYFIFTDSVRIIPNDNITLINQEKEEWPHPSLKRFQNILSLGEKILDFDYIVFNNANIFFRSRIELEEITRNDKKYFGVQYIPFLNKKNIYFPYDRDKKTHGFIKEGKGYNYYTAAFYGGRTKEFLDMCRILNNWYIDDTKSGRYPIWHDESYLNKFFLLNHNDIYIIGPEFGYPEFSYFSIREPKIIFSSKEKYGGWKYLRNTGYQLNIFEKSLFYLYYNYKKVFIFFMRLFKVRKIVELYFIYILKREDF